MTLHGDRCVTRCDPGYVPSIFSLDCVLGKMQPPSFTCTEVAHGFDHGSQLLDACRASDFRKINRLVGMRANLDHRSAHGDTALHVCSLHGHADVINQLLLANAASNAVNVRKWTPLHVAASRGHAATVSLMLQHGGDVSALNDARATPGDLARALAGSVQPHLGKSTTNQQDAALLLMKAERLRANKDCGQDSVCPLPVPGGIRIDMPPYSPTVAVTEENASTLDVSTAIELIVNTSNLSNHTPHDTPAEIPDAAADGKRNDSNQSNETSTLPPDAKSDSSGQQLNTTNGTSNRSVSEVESSD